jgi:hypothetical protein
MRVQAGKPFAKRRTGQHVHRPGLQSIEKSFSITAVFYDVSGQPEYRFNFRDECFDVSVPARVTREGFRYFWV